jgi:DHA1 family bicyclomycin/chloramphenicol resistance-like MFS transporter
MCVGSTANGIVAGVISPLVMHSALGLAIASLLMMGVGLCSWMLIRHRWPGLGEHILHV